MTHTANSNSPSAHRPNWSELVRVFGRIGLLSFGGPAAQIALMHRELVEARSWISDESYLRALSLCMLLPGPEAMQLATYTGWKLRGVAGGVLAGALFVLPGALVISALVAVYVTWGQIPQVQAAFLGVKAAVVATVLAALRGLSERALHDRFDWCVAAASFVGIFALGLPFPLIVATAAVLGAVHIRTAGHVRHLVAPVAWTDTVRTALIWGVLWLFPLLAVTATEPDILARIGWFFAWLATVSFGGAYALLAYMTQTVVAEFGWITTEQMIDALGLAETTPGPLILVTQFVAMLTGYEHGGAGLAIAAAWVSLWATFAPCFLWVFVAAPHVERLSGAPRLGGALKAVTAAVVGVILNLSLWFALNIFFGTMRPSPDWLPALTVPVLESLQVTPVVLFFIACVVLFVLRWPLPVALSICAGCGLVLALPTF